MFEKLKKRKAKKLSEEQYVRIAKAIKEGSPFWAELDTDILVLLLRLSIKKYHKEGKDVDFENMSDADLEEKVREAFLNYDTSSVTPEGIQQLNLVYKKGKNMGLKGRNILKKVGNLINPEDKISAK